MTLKIILCTDCKAKIDIRNIEEYDLCETCDPQVQLCNECWPTHSCNLDDEELESIKGEMQCDTYRENR